MTGFNTKNRTPLSGRPFMGEEKPDEDLMGKRKSSPRLSTTSSDADEFILSALWVIIHIAPKKLKDVEEMAYRRLFLSI